MENLTPYNWDREIRADLLRIKDEEMERARAIVRDERRRETWAALLTNLRDACDELHTLITEPAPQGGHTVPNPTGTPAVSSVLSLIGADPRD